MVTIDLEGIGFAAAAHQWVVGLHQRAKPLPNLSGGIGPLPIVASGGGCNHGESREGGREQLHNVLESMRSIRQITRPARRWLALRLGLRAPSLDGFVGTPNDVPASEKSSTQLHQIFYGHAGRRVQKWRNYLAVYDRHLCEFKSSNVRLLEIGVSDGGSLQMWRDYLGGKAKVFGVDINPECSRFDGAAANVRIGSQADGAFLQSVVQEMGGLDIVVDDGSHIASDQRASFETLFPLLSKNGVYICEDTHTSYWRDGYGGGYRRPTTFLEFSKRIVDDLHADFHSKPLELPGANRMISGIHFYNSIIVIEKSPQPRPMHIAMPASAK
jgi:hypothetical protein